MSDRDSGPVAAIRGIVEDAIGKTKEIVGIVFNLEGLRKEGRAQQDKAVSKLIAGAPLTMTGYLRFPEKAGMLTPKANTVQRLWFARDIGAMATALGWAPDGRIAPFYVDLESPVPDNGIPKPGPLEVHLKDDHMQYAITWFGLAGAVLIAFGVWWRGQRTRPRT